MNSAAVGTIEKAPSTGWSVIRLIPGILLLTVIGYAGKVTEQSIAAWGKAHYVALPNIEYVLWAILFGLTEPRATPGRLPCRPARSETHANGP